MNYSSSDLLKAVHIHLLNAIVILSSSGQAQGQDPLADIGENSVPLMAV